MPQSRHSHSHSRTGHGHGGMGGSGGLGPHARTTSTTSLGSNKRSGPAAVASGLGFTPVAPSSKKRVDGRPYTPYRNVSNESDQIQRTRGKHMPTASQATISGPYSTTQGQTSSEATQTRADSQSQLQSRNHNKGSRSNTQLTQAQTQAQLLQQATNQREEDEDEDEWISSSGAMTPSSAAEAEEERTTTGARSERGRDERERKAMMLREQLQVQANTQMQQMQMQAQAQAQMQTQRKSRQSRERVSRERGREVSVGTPKADKDNVPVDTQVHLKSNRQSYSPTPTRTNGGERERERERDAKILPLPLERLETQRTISCSPPVTARRETFENVPTRVREGGGEKRPFNSPVVSIPSTKTDPPPVSPLSARSQPEALRSPTSPNPTRNKARTRPSSIHSTKSITQHQYSQPHPLIRGSSFYTPGSENANNNKSDAPQASGPNALSNLAPLTSIKAPPVVTNSHTAGVRIPVESPSEMTAYFTSCSPTAVSTRRPSQSSTTSVATTLGAPSIKRASFALTPMDGNGHSNTTTPSSSKFSTTSLDTSRDRKASTASTASIAALSLLARSNAQQSNAIPSSHHTPHHQHNQTQTLGRSTWHFPTLPSLGLTSTPNPTRPSTPPPLCLKLPAQRLQSSPLREGGSRYRNYLRRKQGYEPTEKPNEHEHSYGELGTNLESEEDEEGIGEWIPQPYFGEHLTAIRWAVRTTARQSFSGGKAGTHSQGQGLRRAEAGVLRQSWKRVCAARVGTEITK